MGLTLDQEQLPGEVDTPSVAVCEPDAACLWYVLHTRSRQEKALTRDLTAMGIRHYLPTSEQTRYYGRRKVLVDVPLFAGYVFLRGTIEQAYQADRTDRVARLIPVPDQDTLAWELENIQLALTRQAPLDAYPYLRTGVRVEVRSGPFRGLQGRIDRRTRHNRLVVQIDTLGQAAGLEIDGALLEPID